MVIKDEYDIIVVGAGPSGSSAAKKAAEQGLKVLLIEKRQEIGEPIRCGEAVFKKSLIEIIKPDPKCICSKIFCGRVYGPDGRSINLTSNGNEIGYVLYRNIFDRELVRSAAASGVEVRTKTSATSLIIKNGIVTGIKGKHLGDDFMSYAKIVVGADGIESKIGRMAGIDTALKLNEIGTCAQYHVSDINIDPSVVELYSGRYIAPGGYAWVFPKGEREANIGIGMIGKYVRDKHPVDHLNDFISKKFPDGKIIGYMAGGVPSRDIPERISTGGLLLAGDAARLCDPLTGAGIINGIKSGNIAGEVASKAIISGDVSAKALQEYDREIWRSMGISLQRNHIMKEAMIRMTDGQYSLIIDMLKAMGIERIDANDFLGNIYTKGAISFSLLSLFLRI
jgi:digeranylgeranylglycerophospholipid reductase